MKSLTIWPISAMWWPLASSVRSQADRASRARPGGRRRRHALIVVSAGVASIQAAAEANLIAVRVPVGHLGRAVIVRLTLRGLDASPRNLGDPVVEVEGRAVEQWAEKVAAEAGFTSVDHTVELFGLCPEHSL